MKHLTPASVLSEIATRQKTEIASQACRFAETGHIGAMHAGPMDAGRRLAGEKQALTNRSGKSLNIIGRRAEGDVAVRSLSKRIAVPCRHSQFAWRRHIRPKYIRQDARRPQGQGIVRPALDCASLITTN